MRAVIAVLLCAATPTTSRPSPAPSPYPDASATQRGVVNTFDQAFGGKKSAPRFISTSADQQTAVDGGANFSCPNNPASSSPCLAHPRDSLEIGGYFHTSPQDDSDFSVLIGALLERDGGSVLDVMNGFGVGSETKVLRVMWNGNVRQWGSFLYGNQQSSSNGFRIVSPNGGLYLVSTNGEVLVENVAAGNVMSWYGPSSTLAGTLKDDGSLDLRTGPSSNSCTLDGASPSKCNVATFANAKCVCSVVSTAGAAPCTVNLVTTTLTAYSSSGLTNLVNVDCH